jgi:hypothetical protein
MPTHSDSSGSGISRLRTPSPTERVPPTRKMPSAARNAQKYRSCPRPNGCSASGSPDDLRSPTNSSTSLPVSATEWAASAHSEAEPVNSAATVFAMAIPRFAATATTTVRALSSSAMQVAQEARCRSSRVTRRLTTPGSPSTVSRIWSPPA